MDALTAAVIVAAIALLLTPVALIAVQKLGLLRDLELNLPLGIRLRLIGDPARDPKEAALDLAREAFRRVEKVEERCESLEGRLNDASEEIRALQDRERDLLAQLDEARRAIERRDERIAELERELARVRGQLRRLKRESAGVMASQAESVVAELDLADAIDELRDELDS